MFIEQYLAEDIFLLFCFTVFLASSLSQIAVSLLDFEGFPDLFLIVQQLLQNDILFRYAK